jgi:membrane protein YqaA with SNARE-associated domain
MLRRLYDWTLDLAGHRHALAALAAVAFVESSIFPIPPDVLIIPMVLAARERAWRIATVATVASALGGLAGYGIGAGLYEALGRAIIEFYGLTERFQDFSGLYNEWGALIVFTAGFSPIPYKVFTIASGVTGMDLSSFLAASIVSRGARFFLLAVLLWYFGEPIRRFIERNLPLLTLVFCVMLVAGFIALRYLF